MRPLAIALALAAFLPGGLGAAASTADYAAINRAVTADHIRPAYDRAARAGLALRVALRELCDRPEGPGLERARSAFHRAVDAWQGAAHLRFGPADALSAHARLNFWPDKRGRVGKHLRRLMAKTDAAALHPDRIATGSVAVQGFPALERLLFAGDPLARMQSRGGAVTPCAAAAAIAGNIAEITADIAAAWREDLLAAKRTKDGTGALFNSLASGLQAVSDLKMGAPLGGKSGRVRAKRAEHWRSGRALRNVERNLFALNDLYVRMAGAAGPALQGTDRDTLIRQLFNRSLAEAKALGPSFKDAAATENGVLRLKALAAEINDLRNLILGHVTEALGLVLGFNSFDGD